MMDWLLIITISIHGQQITVPWGLTRGPLECELTGRGVVMILRAAQPDAVVQFSCAPQVVA